MTFYWWSHWFWITILYNVCLLVTAVSTYPSGDITTMESINNRKQNKADTKIYQTTSTFSGSSVSTRSPIEKQIFSSSATTGSIDYMRIEDQDFVKDDEAEILEYDENNEKTIEDEGFLSQKIETVVNNDNEFKRSIEVNNISSHNFSVQIQEQTKPINDTFALSSAKKLLNGNNHREEELSNYTNSSFKQGYNLTTGPNITDLSQNTNNSITATILTPTITNSGNNLGSFTSITHFEDTHKSHVSLFDDTPPSTDISNLQKVPFTLENVNKEDELRRAESEHRTRKPKVLSAEYKQINRVINYSIDSKSLLTRSASTARNMFDNLDENNIASEALSVQRTYFLDASAISAICLTVFGLCCTVGTIAIVLYRRRFLNKPQALSEPDSSVYIDDSTMRDNSDEMYSLDNDSFLNSLEAMTIQNYWTDTVKHTKL